MKDAEREKAKELFGTTEEPTALASKIIGTRSRTFDTSVSSSTDRASSFRKPPLHLSSFVKIPSKGRHG